MKDTEWTEERLKALVGQEESLHLEFKSGSLLDKDRDEVALDLTRQVSALANAEGGDLIIGMGEAKRGNLRVAETLDDVPAAAWASDTLQRVIESNIYAPVRVRVKRIPLPSVGSDRVAYVITVPESVTAHQAKDFRYYVRSELEVKALRDYEIRLRMHRGVMQAARLALRISLRRESC